jgi:MFS family permease
MGGLALYATGLVIIVAGPAAQWYDLLPGFLVAGLGVGCTMSPMQTIATRNVDPRLAGAASGVLNTIRQTGAALGSAVVLAVLQNRLAAGHSYVGAMRYAIAVPVTALLIGALLSLAVQPPRTPNAQNAQADPAGPVAEEARSGAATTARSGQPERSPEQDPQRVAG